MTDQPSSETLARVLSGQGTPEEHRDVERWATADAANASELERLRACWLPGPEGAWDVDRAWHTVSQRLDQPVERLAVRRFPVPLRIAASIALALGAALVWRAVRPTADALPQVVATAPGNHRSVDLPDGTRITVAPGSELRVDRDYGRSERRVDLVGEAWFEVPHDASKPFRVFAAGAIVEDLGTEFAVRALPGERTIRVAVVSGQASLRREDASEAEALILEPNDVARLDAGDNAPTVERGVPLDAFVAWRRGLVVLEDAPLDSVVAELSRWYGITFRLADPASATRRLTATLRIDALDDALQVLGLSLGLRVERQGRDVVLY